MTTEVRHFCRVITESHEGHGLQIVQSILMPHNFYYLECGCIYCYDDEEDFKLLKPDIQLC